MGFFDDLGKKYKETIFRPADSPFVKVQSYPTGIATVDTMLEGGIPKGRVTEIYGEFSTLKTMLALLTCATALRIEPERHVLYFDFEYAITPSYMEACGISMDNPNFHITQPTSPENAIKMACEAITDGNLSVIVFDSVVAMQPKAITEGSVESAGIGVHAKMLGKACVQLTPLAAIKDTSVIFINQVRVNLSGYGSPETRPGGKALDFYSDLMLRMGKSKIDVADKTVGSEISVLVFKSKVCRPYSKCTFNMFFDTGVDFIGSTIKVAQDLDIVVRAGSWFTYGDVKVQGVAALTQYFVDNPLEYDELKQKIAVN